MEKSEGGRKMDAMQAILTRKSVRSYTGQKVTDQQVQQIIEAGMRAPSGLANEPWRFAIVRDPQVKGNIAQLTKHTKVLEGADVLICLFMDNEVGYDLVKDSNTIGACAENMLLAAHAMGLGAVWIAETRKNKDRVAEECGVDPERYDMMVVIPVGYSAESADPTPRKRTLDEVIIGRK